MTTKSIYDLALHESCNIGDEIFYTRVPGGWVYLDNTCATTTAVFVPYNEEFAPTKESEPFDDRPFCLPTEHKFRSTKDGRLMCDKCDWSQKTIGDK